MDIKELLELVLTQTGTLSKDGVAGLFEPDGSLKADAQTTILNADKTRVATLKKAGFDEGHGKAKRETFDAFEKQLKEKFGVDADKTGVELVEAIVNEKVGKAGTVTEEQVKSHKAYLDLKESQDKAVKEAAKTVQQQFDAYKSQVENEKVVTQVKQRALSKLDSLNPILPEDAAKATKQKELFLKEVAAGRYRIEGEKVILMKEDGTDLTDEHGNRVDFEKHVETSAASIFDFKAGDGRQGAGGQKKQGEPGQGAKKYSFKDAADFQKQFYGTNDSKERAEIAKAYNEQQQNQ